MLQSKMRKKNCHGVNYFFRNVKKHSFFLIFLKIRKIGDLISDHQISVKFHTRLIYMPIEELLDLKTDF